MTPGTREDRRVPLGDQLSVVFEGGDAVATLPAEATAGLRPDGPGLLAVLYLEVAQAGELMRVSAATSGVERQLYLDIGGSRAPGTPLTGHDESAEPAAAWAVWFPLTETQRREWLDGAEVAVAAERAGGLRVQLTPEQRRTIAQDL